MDKSISLMNVSFSIIIWHDVLIVTSITVIISFMQTLAIILCIMVRLSNHMRSQSLRRTDHAN